MPTVMNSQHFPQRGSAFRTAPQKICISFGYGFIVLGFLGVLMPGLLHLHLSMAHNMVYIISGAVALYCGYSNSSRSIAYAIGFGAIYGLLGIAGYVMGEPGYPGVGNMSADQNLFRVIPDILEFGTMDHIVHLLIGSFLLFTAYTFRKEKRVVRNPSRN